MSELTLEVMARCDDCSSKLKVVFVDFQSAGIMVDVEPCTKCGDKVFAEGRIEGRAEGKAEAEREASA